VGHALKRAGKLRKDGYAENKNAQFGCSRHIRRLTTIIFPSEVLLLFCFNKMMGTMRTHCK
jgi:hypothetical protein